MDNYLIIGAGGLGTYVSTENVVSIALEPKSPNTTLYVFYESGIKATILLAGNGVDLREVPLWLNYMVKAFIKHNDTEQPIGFNWNTIDNNRTIGGPMNRDGTYPSELPFPEFKGKGNVRIDSITMSIY